MEGKLRSRGEALLLPAMLRKSQASYRGLNMRYLKRFLKAFVEGFFWGAGFTIALWIVVSLLGVK
jgi:hypothetical protein